MFVAGWCHSCREPYLAPCPSGYSVLRYCSQTCLARERKHRQRARKRAVREAEEIRQRCAAPECTQRRDQLELCPADLRIVENSCRNKLRHRSAEDAKQWQQRRHPAAMAAYPCAVCLAWHLGNGPDQVTGEEVAGIAQAMVARLGEQGRAALAVRWAPQVGRLRRKRHCPRTQGQVGKFGGGLDGVTLTRLAALRAELLEG